MKIVTDSAADLTAADLQTHGIVEVPLFIQFPDQEIKSADLSADDFYNRLRALYPTIPTTSQPSSGMFAQIYQETAAADPEILSVHISSGLSGTSQSARTGAAQAVAAGAKVNVWDTRTLSGGERYQVLAAAAAAKKGWSFSAIEKRLSALRDQTEIVFTLETLDYLARGGRIGRVQALAGALIKIKPIIRVEHNDGKYSTVGKSRHVNQALNHIAEHLHRLYRNAPVWVTVLHGQFPGPAESLTELLKKTLTVGRLEMLRVSPVLGVHTGPGVVGAAVVPMALIEDLLPEK